MQVFHTGSSDRLGLSADAPLSSSSFSSLLVPASPPPVLLMLLATQWGEAVRDRRRPVPPTHLLLATQQNIAGSFSHTQRSHSHSQVAAHLPAARGEALSRTGWEGGDAQMDTQAWKQQIVSKVRDGRL